ncbi:MAG TPA: 30S ribosomal protein S7 [Elusimicrobia bacterium]|nr:30S ribosomal protein S7 [Elusimicrobiota bacterium]HBT62843.1 30S ribosomal protein S7 [Elusimicrobiota bacterium]
MPRKGLRPRDRRSLPPADFKYSSVLVSRLINKLNYRGQKNVSERIMYGAMDILAERAKEDALNVLTKAIENVRPLLEVKARRVGGATYQVPIEVNPTRSSTLAMRWILDAARAKTGKPMAVRLAEELLAASKKEGVAFKKREDTHKMAEANRAFAHYRW